jgi:hypothetical protein
VPHAPAFFDPASFDQASTMVQRATNTSERDLAPLESEPSTLVRATASAIAARFLSQLAFCSDGIGWVHALESWRRHGVLARIASAGTSGVELATLARQTGANLGYLAVMVRVLAAQGWMWRRSSPRRAWTEARAEHTRAGLTPEGTELFALLASGSAARRIVGFLPIARRMTAYLEGSYDPPEGAPSLAELAARSARGWDLPVSDLGSLARVKAALDGNLLGPVAVALITSPSFEWVRSVQRSPSGTRGRASRVEPRTAREQAALEVLAHAGWVNWHGAAVEVTDLGAYALRRGLAYGVPVSYLPLFEGVDELFFGDPALLWRLAPGEPERHVDRALNVRASGASHARYFAAADEIIKRAFDLPWPEQPLGFCDMGSGDGAWLEHVWGLIGTRTERGRLMRAFPHDARYAPLMIGADYNEAARAATHERLTRAGIPHVVTFGDVNDPDCLRRELARRGVDSTRLLHGSSFLVHNRPYTGVRAGAPSLAEDADGTYAWRGQPVDGAELEQNLVEFFGDWREVIGAHGMIVIELHDPEQVTVGKTLTSYMLTHGLSDQLAIGLTPFLRAAAAAGLVLDRERQRYFPEPRSAATISVNHFRRG